MPEQSEPQPATPPPIKRKLQVGFLRYVAGALTAIAVIGGAGWLWRQRKRRNGSS